MIFYYFYYIRKDFRAHVLNAAGIVPQGVLWKSQVLDVEINNIIPSRVYKYKYEIFRDINSKNYTGFYVEIILNFKKNILSKKINGSQFFKVTSETNIIPEYDSIGDCHGSECFGYLV